MTIPDTWYDESCIEYHFVDSVIDDGKTVILFKHYKPSLKCWIYGCMKEDALIYNFKIGSFK